MMILANQAERSNVGCFTKSLGSILRNARTRQRGAHA